MLSLCFKCCKSMADNDDDDEPDNIIIKPKITINCSCFRGAPINNNEETAETPTPADEKNLL